MEEESYKVKLDVFEGPLDLLLYLIRKDEVDIFDVNIERIAKQYIEYLDAMRELDIDLAGEFVVMAANLMYLKSRTLLPKEAQPPEADAEEDDPRWELIRQLIEYKKFKDAAGFLARRQSVMENIYPAVPEVPEELKRAKPGAGADFPEIGVFDLIRAFQKVLRRFEKDEVREIADDRFTVSDRILHLLRAVAPGESVPFLNLFPEGASRDEVIVTFVALLELVKLRRFQVAQEHLLGEITLRRSAESVDDLNFEDGGEGEESDEAEAAGAA